jgi:AraC-like DNA-binding protein
VPAEEAGAIEARVLPDGCVDLVWTDGDLTVAGPDRGPVRHALRPGTEIAGARIVPGRAGEALGWPASDLRDLRVPLEELWGERAARLAEELAAAGDPARRRELLADALDDGARRTGSADPLVMEAVRRIEHPGARMHAIGRDLAMSERQLRRRFLSAVGYGPKTLHRVLRFRRFLALAPALAAREDTLAACAAELGYADQAHLARECRELAGLPPGRLIGAWTS